jgi:DNA (cytosine-5)-methyltransferase 1
MKKVVSLFAGIGGFDLGFTRAGFEIVAHVEKDANCRKLLASKWPAAVALDDVCTAGAHNLPPCDVITFGFPCQDLSVAGKRAGLAGGRSGLYYEATRIINELKPAYCLFENVPGLLSSDGGRDFARVLMEMDRIGYHGAWRVLDAQWLGVAQRRRRVFGLFSRLDSGAERCAQVLSLQESLCGHPAPRRETGQGVAPILEAGARTGVSTTDIRAGSGIGDCGDPMFTLQAGKQHAVAGTLDRKSCGANRGSQANETGFIVPAVAGCLQERDAKGADRGMDVVAVPVAFQPGNLMRRAGAEPSTASFPTLGAATLGDQAPCVAFRPNNSSQSRSLGESENLSCTLPSEEGGNKVCVATAMQVRRLTPTECERLQGFPDGWTAGFSDSTRYKMLGNAVCVNVAEWIARRLKNPA